MSAARHEHHHDMIADRKIVHILAELFDDSGSFMTERHW